MNLLSVSCLYVVCLFVAIHTASATLRGAAESHAANETLELPPQQDGLDSSTVLEEREQRETLNLQPRIIGGTTASQGQHPYFVLWSGCGATLVWMDIVLSAAHCNVQSSNRVIVGAYKRNSVSHGAVERTITARRVHPSFSSTTDSYDFLVLKLNSPVSQTPAKLNSNANYPTTNQVLTVIGMGYTVQNGQQPDYLQQVNVNYVTPQACAGVYGADQAKGSFTLCASVPQGGKDACQGDSGGPILDSTGTQLGVTSFGHGCALPGYPGVYARISGSIDWINQQICQLSSSPPSSCSTTPSVTIRIDIKYQNNPSLVSWAVTNPYGAVKGTSKGYGSAGMVKSSYIRLPRGTYLFNLKDKGTNNVATYGIYASYSGRVKRLAYGTSVSLRSSQQIKFVL